jgi:hypothetical protein
VKGVVFILAAVAVVEGWLLVSVIGLSPLWAYGTVVMTLAWTIAFLLLRASQSPPD